MKKELRKAAQRMLARASELGLVTQKGTALVVDLMEELLAAKEGYRNVHAYKAALDSRDPPALEQENPDEAGNDYILVNGKGCWIAMGQFAVHPFLTDNGVEVEIYPNGAETDSLSSIEAYGFEAEVALTDHHDIDSEAVATWVKDVFSKDFETASSAQRYAWIRQYMDKDKQPSIKGHLNVNGTETGRFSGTEAHESNVPKANLPRIALLLAALQPPIAGETQAAQSLADRVNANRDSATVVTTLTHAGQEYDLRICAVGADSFFEWIDDLGDPVGDMFYHRTNATEAEFRTLLVQAEARVQAQRPTMDSTLGTYGLTLGLSNDKHNAGTWEWYSRETKEFRTGFATKEDAYRSAADYLQEADGVTLPEIDDDGYLPGQAPKKA